LATHSCGAVLANPKALRFAHQQRPTKVAGLRRHPGSKRYHRQKLRLASADRRGCQSVSKILVLGTLTNRGGCALSSEFALLSSKTSVSGI